MHWPLLHVNCPVAHVLFSFFVQPTSSLRSPQSEWNWWSVWNYSWAFNRTNSINCFEQFKSLNTYHLLHHIDIVNEYIWSSGMWIPELSTFCIANYRIYLRHCRLKIAKLLVNFFFIFITVKKTVKKFIVHTFHRHSHYL